MAINKHYAQLEFGSGLFFLYSKEEKEGYDKHTSTKGNVSYRKYFKDGISGILESVSIYKGDFGNSISMNIKDGDDVYYAPVSLTDQGGNVDTYAESLIKLLPNLNKGDNVVVKGYNFVPEGDKYSKIGMSITVSGEKVKGALTNSYMTKEGLTVNGDIPALIWKKNAMGKNKPTAVSLEAKNDFLLEKVLSETERLKWVKDGESSVPSTPPDNKTNNTELTVEQDDDFELPF